MITITPDAALKLKELILENNEGKEIPETAGLRLFVQGGGCSGFQYGLMIEKEPQPNDLVTESHGIKIFIDPISISYVKNSFIHLKKVGDNEGIAIENPNATSTCGCGSSFNTDQS